MEEKRYRLESYNEAFCEIHDTKLDEWYLRKDLIVDLLNQQSKRIKELEEENDFLEKRNKKLMIDRRDLCLERNDIFEESQQLKQSQNQLTISELEKLKIFIDHNIEIENDIGALKLQEFYDNQIKKLKGEMREKK